MAAPKKYPDELRERAVRLYRESDPKPVIRQLARQLGVHHEALRNWIRQDEADRGQRDDRPTTSELEELRRLRRENAELKRANEILKAASLDSDDQRNAAGGWVDRGSDGSAGNVGRDETGLVAALACR
ncbi:transposase [Micromonospora gifhornensis]|uniref:transposase n=1 Tax=Micromonospora gifhornensis TaxID=84594 RepID=UPI003D712ABC